MTPRRFQPKLQYCVEISVRPADSDDPGFATGIRVPLADVQRAVDVAYETFTEYGLEYLERNGYK